MYNFHKYSIFLAFFQFPLLINSDEGKPLQGNNALSPENFGPIKVEHEMLALCKGAKQRDCCQTTLKTSKNFELMELVFNLPNNVQIVKVKIDLYYKRNNVSNAIPDIVKWVKHPCDHFFFGPAIRAVLRVSPGCIVQKGTYKYAVNATAEFYNLYGDKFFYGAYKTQSAVMSKDCNILCLISHVKLDRLT